MGQIEQFEDGWKAVRGLTYDFLDAVPDARWAWSPHPNFATLDKQMRHMVGVQGVYLQGLRERRADFAAKHGHYAGRLDRASIKAALQAKDAELALILDTLRGDDAAGFSIDFYGVGRGFQRYTAIMIQHEAIHHGQWSFYAALGGFETPKSWKFNWGL